MWKVNEKGEREFKQGQQDWSAAAQAAQMCTCFQADDEDEWTADEPVSCYNCSYRRWTAKSFICSK
jgi:hypothetical protein